MCHCQIAESMEEGRREFMERLVEVNEQEVRIQFSLNCKCRATVRLQSRCANSTVAFKVQTSAPHKFLVNPPSGLLPPLSQTTFQVILKPQTQLPHSYPRSPADRFLIKTAKFVSISNPSETTLSDSVNSWFAKRPDPSTQDVKLKVAFVGPLLLRHAVSRGNVDAAKSLIKRQKSILYELHPSESESILRLATELYNPEPMVNLLLDSGLRMDARVQPGQSNSPDKDPTWASKGWEELHVAVASDHMDEVFRLLKTRKFDCRDNEGRTPLHLAASKGNIRCARVLVESGADINAQCSDGRTALYTAVANGHCPMVQLLIHMGADPTIANDRGRSPFDVARDKGHEEMTETMERGETVLAAARHGDVRQLKTLLHTGSRANYRDRHGLTALHTAAFKGHKDIVWMLVEHGLQLECEDNEGHVPLHMAVLGGKLEIVQILVQKGVKMDVKNKKGASPLFMAGVFGFDEIEKFLMDSGASPVQLSNPS